MVTVLFADLVDSTGLGQRLDPERAREVLGRFFDAVTDELQALRGRPEKFIGDAVMAVFGLPTVHEDDALRAVRAGLAIRGRVRRLGNELGLPTPLQVRVGDRIGRRRDRAGTGGTAPRHRPRRERRGAPADRGRTRRGARGRDHAHADRVRGRVRRTAEHPCQGIHARPPGAHGRGSHDAVRTPHDPARRSLRRSDDPARMPLPCDHHGETRLGDRRGGGRHREVPSGRRADRRFGRRCAGAGRARAIPRRDRHVRATRGGGRRPRADRRRRYAREDAGNASGRKPAVMWGRTRSIASPTVWGCCSASRSGTTSPRSSTTCMRGSSRSSTPWRRRDRW